MSPIGFQATKPVSTKRPPPVWRGPEEDGVTYSLLSRFLVCRERFRLRVVEGWQPAERWNHRAEYGQMWHLCERVLAAAPPTRSPGWEEALVDYCRGLSRKYPLQREQVEHWQQVCRVQFPIYVDYWARHVDVTERRPLLQEQSFDVPYGLPSGRTVRLRGKWDAVDLVGRGRGAGVYLFETKTKGDIKEGQIKRQLTFDLQTMVYLAALHWVNEHDEAGEGLPVGRRRYGTTVAGVRYNVVRRPLSGGKGSISRHKPTKTNPQGETAAEFYGRLKGLIAAEPESYFMRWKVEVIPDDVGRFRRECLDPILEQLWDWWEYIRLDSENPLRGYDENYGSPHWRHPYGVYNVLDEGGSDDLDEYLASGSTVGLERVTTLFPELEDE